MKEEEGRKKEEGGACVDARARQAFFLLPSLFFLLVSLGCAGDGTAVAGDPVELSVTGLRPLDPATEGVYEAWAIGEDGTIASAGRFTVEGDPSTQQLNTTLADPASFMVTVEPPGDDDESPSLHRLLGGRFEGGTALLGTTGYLTVAGIPIEETPGTHVLATATDTAFGHVPSESGLWLYNIGGDTLDGSYYLDFSPLTEGWWYEGWIVYDYGASEAMWITYGKFRSDAFRQANLRDDTGLGPFSGRSGYEAALPLQVRVPGDDWLANPPGLSMPGGMALPLDLNGDASAGTDSRWTHVITIEPWGPNRDAEPLDESRPFFLAPYQNAIGEAAPDQPRTIAFDADVLPTGIVRLR